MGWASGSELAENAWDLVRYHIPRSRRKDVARKFIDQFEQMDCDTMDECEQLMKDAELPDTCYDCGKFVGYGNLTESGECNDCAEKYR